MVLFEVIQALIGLDLEFFISLLFNNFFLAFGIFAAVYFFFDKKDVIIYYLAMLGIIWAFVDIETLTGLAFVSSGFLVIYYITKISLLAFAENSPSLKRYMIVLSTAQFYLAFFIYNFVLGGSL